MRGLKHKHMGSDRVAFTIRNIVLIVIAVLLFLYIVRGMLANYTVTLEYESSNIPKQYIGTKIAHVSCIHNESNSAVIKSIKKAKPDLIVVTGGLVDDEGNYDKSVKVLDKLNEIAPTVFIGSESDGSAISSIASSTQAKYLVDTVTVLEPSNPMTAEKYINDIKSMSTDDEEFEIYKEYVNSVFEEDASVKISLAGLRIAESGESIKDEVYKLEKEAYGTYKMLMVPSVNYFDGLSKQSYDIVFSSGTHGVETNGYKEGVYAKDGTSLILSRGLEYSGNGKKPITFRPKVYIIELSDGVYGKDNIFDKLTRVIMKDTGTIFEEDDFKIYKSTYGGIEDVLEDK